MAILGIDIGGTSTKLAIVGGKGAMKILAQSSTPTLVNEPVGIMIEAIAAAARKLMATCPENVIGTGVGCPGIVDPAMGVVHKSSNIRSLVEFKLREKFAKVLGLPVEIDNDAKAALQGEVLFGSSVGVQNLVMLTLGTGIGGGVIVGGQILRGADNAATELGHIKIQPGGAACGCGKNGCLEAYAGSGGITRIAEQILASGVSSSLKGQSLSTRIIAEAAARGDTAAIQILSKVGHYLGMGISMLIETFNPEKIVLAGGASPAIEFFRPGINAALLENCSYAFTRDRTRIERAAYPDDINVIGAAAVYATSHREAM